MSIKCFFNPIEFNNSLDTNNESTENWVSSHQANKASSGLNFIGDFCLYPMRVLFNDDKIEISYTQFTNNTTATVMIRHSASEAWNDRFSYNSNRKALSTTAAIVLLIPSTIIGLAFKSIAYLSSSQLRENYRFAMKYYDPLMRGVIVLGEEGKRVNKNEIDTSINNLRSTIHACKYQEFIYKNYRHMGLILYTDPDTILNDFKSFRKKIVHTIGELEHAWHQKIPDLTSIVSKIILVGARLRDAHEKLLNYSTKFKDKQSKDKQSKVSWKKEMVFIQKDEIDELIFPIFKMEYDKNKTFPRFLNDFDKEIKTEIKKGKTKEEAINKLVEAMTKKRCKIFYEEYKKDHKQPIQLNGGAIIEVAQTKNVKHIRNALADKLLGDSNNSCPGQVYTVKST